jgi:hypothetical protein
VRTRRTPPEAANLAPGADRAKLGGWARALRGLRFGSEIAEIPDVVWEDGVRKGVTRRCEIQRTSADAGAAIEQRATETGHAPRLGQRRSRRRTPARAGVEAATC